MTNIVLPASIVESSDDAIEGLSFDGNVLFWNKGSEELYGYNSAEMINKSVLTVYPKNRSEELAKIITTIKAGGHAKPFVTQRIDKKGSVIDVAISASPIKDSAGKLI